MNIGPYELLDEVAQGAMGAVYRAIDPRTGAVVAVKALLKEQAREPSLLRRFERECAAAQLLEHPHIVRGIDFGIAGGRPYLVMEFVDGPTLGAVVDARGPLPTHQAVGVAVQVASGLELAHRHRLIHRDVKPDNVLIAPDGQAKLADLGLVKNLAGDPGLTGAGVWLGTVDYMAPEQFGDARNVDARCDVYGLAATLYFALTGARPFPALRARAILDKKLRNDFVPPRGLLPTLRPGIDAAIRDALDAAPTRRPASCAAFADRLQAALAEDADASPPAGDEVEQRKSRRYPSRLGARCRPLQGESSGEVAVIRDVSLSGICLETEQRFVIGAILFVEVDDGDGRPLLAQVRWVRPLGQGLWTVGCAFARALTEEELVTLLGQKATSVVLAPATAAG